MKLTITNKITQLKGRKGVYANSDCGALKTGYSVFDEHGTFVGIAYLADDKTRHNIYHKGTILLFDEQFEKVHKRIWHTIKINKEYLSYEKLKETFAKGKDYELYIDL